MFKAREGDGNDIESGSLTYKVSQGAKMSSDSMKNIVCNTTVGWIVMDQRIKTRGGWVAGVDLFVIIFIKRLMLLVQQPAQQNLKRKKNE